ncbi:MAG: hypothetical protein Q8934_12905 [Bacillota bacterium]|nr:hypothetical protein [Bacillota bacterium]
MPSISKIRFTNVVYEDGMKRYNDEIFKFDGYNGAILLENGGGKTVFIQTALQAIIPHTSLSARKIRQTLQLDNYPAHIAIEWILSENPRRYLVTCVSLFLTKDGLGSYRYVYPYQAGDRNGIEGIPFVRNDSNRPADRGEISDYYQQMSQQYMNAQTFSTIKDFQRHIEEQYHIIANEWESIVKINSTEGGVEAFFDECKQTSQLFDRLLIPTVESAIAGHDQNTFVDTFEKHRASFKLYKELKEQIEENKAIDEELNRYVLTYQGLYEEQQVYDQKKQQAKAVLNLIQNQEQDHKISLESIQSKMNDWEVKERYYLKKLLSFEIQREQLQFEALQKELNEYTNNLTVAKEDLSYATNSFYSLKYAELKKALKEEQDRLQILKNQLKTLDQDEDIHEIKGNLEDNSRELLGYFLHELEESQKRKHGLEIERKPIEENVKQYESQVKTLRNQLKEVNRIYDNNTGNMGSLSQQMNRIQKRILSNPDQESVKDLVKQWEERLVFLDDQMVQLKNDNKQLSEMMTEGKNQRESLVKQKEEKENERIKCLLEIKQAESAQEKVKEIVGALRTQWAAIDSIYLKQDSLTQQIHDTIHRLNKEKETCLHKERLARRFMDDYETQDLFFADPFIEKQVKQWGNQFHLLETGIQFIQSIEDSFSENIKNYPLWPMTLITTETERDELKRKIKNVDNELLFPVEVLTIEEARAIVQGENQNASLITPNHWHQNQNFTLFQQWKQTMKNRAEEATNARKELEAKVQVWNQVAEKLESFIREYPYEEYQSRKDYLAELIQNIQKLNTKQKEIQLQLFEWEDKLTTQKERIDTYRQEYNGLHGKAEAAYEYLHLNKEYLDLEKIQEQLVGQMKEYDRTIKNDELQISKLTDEKKHVEERERDENYYYQSLIEDEIYFEVKTVTPKYTNKSRTILKKEREELNFALRKVSSTRNEIQIQLDHSNKELNRVTKDLGEMVLIHGSLNEELVFPPNGKEQISYFREKMKDLEQVVEKEREQFTTSKEKTIRQEKVLEMAVDKFHESFPSEDPETFGASLSEVQDLLKVERKQLKNQQDFLLREQKRIGKESESIRAAFYELDRFEEAHHFKGPSVSASVLSELDIQDFTYERVAFVKNVTTQLKQGKEKVSKEWEIVERAKEAFKVFCKNKITNVKMREMARQGIESKESYKEVVEFQSHMQKRIQTAIKYNEASIINHDKQLEQFVTHINTHLRTISGELDLIPKKTKVKV